MATLHQSSQDGVPLKGPSMEYITLQLDSLKIKLESKLAAIKMDAENEKSTLKQVYGAAMVKLPRSIKSMRVGEFNALYKCDLVAVVEDMRAAGKKRERLETPSQQTTSASRVPLMTPSRTVRRGEVLYSKNGSPVETADEGCLIATVTKSKKRRMGSTGDDVGASLDINLGDGQFISLQDPTNVNSLDDDKKSMALQQLQMLKDQVDYALKHLQN